MQPLQKFSRIAAFLALLGWGMGAAVPLAHGGEGGQPTLIFVSKSDACECERNLCMAGEQEAVNFLSGNPWNFRLERVDLAENPEAAKALGILAVPVVFLHDGQGRQIARFDGYFSWKDLEQVWRTHLAAGQK